MTELYQCLKDTPIRDYQKSFQNLAKRLKLCVKVEGGCFE